MALASQPQITEQFSWQNGVMAVQGEERSTNAPVTPRPERERLLSLYYEEFRRIARRVLAGSGPVQIQPTELVHEAAMRILGGEAIALNDQAHFLALGTRVMRMTLIDEVRRRKASKRGGDIVTLWDERAERQMTFDIEDFDDALARLGEVEAEGARIVELRFYAGLTMEEIAANLRISESTIHRRWRAARAWLLKELQAAT